MTQPEHSPSQPEDQNSEAEKSLFTRRQFVGTGIMAAAALALPKSAQADPDNSAKTLTSIPTNCSPITVPPANSAFKEPPKISSVDGKINETISTKFSSLTGLPKGEIQVRTYNCSIPGKTLYVNPGDEINILLQNELPEDGNQPCHLKPEELAKDYKPHCFNTTNLHFHGLHVSPKSTDRGIASDDVLVEVFPGKRQRYCVILPKFHAPGTHWYHSHLHGATGLQVSNGLAGAIIIPEPKKNQIVEEDQDKVWLIQEVIGNDKNDPNLVYKGNASPVYLVNGIYQPTITVNKLEWQRWRFINAGATPRSLTNLKLVKSSNGTVPTPGNINPNDIIPMWLIAVDGISFYGHKPQEKKGWDLAPGNRADFLVWFPENTPDDATYYLIKDTFPGVGKNAIVNQVLAQVTFTSKQGQNLQDPSNLIIPGELPDYLKPIEYGEIFTETGILRHSVQDIRFTIPRNPRQPGFNGFGVYDVNEEQYGLPKASPIEATLNTAEIWTLRNIGSTTGSPGSPHPFHIHVNPFQIVGDKIDPDGCNDSSNWRWWDTIAVIPPSETNPNTAVAIVQRFPDYYGHYVLHCHILIHEDLGMMRDVIIHNDDGCNGKEPCQKVFSSTFAPSKNPRYITCEEVAKIIPTDPYQPQDTTSNPNFSSKNCQPDGKDCPRKPASDAAASTPSTPTTSTPSNQAPASGSGSGGGKGLGGGPGSGGGKGLGGGPGSGGGLGK